MQENVLSGLEGLDQKSLSRSGQAAIADAIRSIVNRHKRHEGEEWALTEVELAPLEEMLGRFEPSDPVDRNLWLFDLMPELPGKRDIDYEERSKLTRSRRQDALSEIFNTLGLAGVLRMVEGAKRPSDVGLALADLELDASAELEFLRVALACDPTRHEMPSLAQAVWEYAPAAYARGGMDWLHRISTDPEISSKPSALVNLILALPPERATWDIAQEWGDLVEKAYWERTTISVLRDEATDSERAIKSLLDAGRPYRALQV
ncbi:MAG: hypothetical protein JRC86_13605, partial [Deltaproteobacteria bacterium]|nr:hypothetical protein [Deltaproteobacteria bacterium]